MNSITTARRRPPPASRRSSSHSRPPLLMMLAFAAALTLLSSSSSSSSSSFAHAAAPSTPSSSSSCPARIHHKPSPASAAVRQARGGSSSSGADEGVREVLRGEGLLSTVTKAIKREGSRCSVAPVLFIGSRDDKTRDLLADLFDFVQPYAASASGSGGAPQVTIAPFGDDEDEDEERQAVAVVATLAAEEEDLTSGAFPAAARDAAVTFALAGDVVLAVPVTDVLRGELRGVSLLQTALEQYLHFQDKRLVDPEAPQKTLHLVVNDVEEAEAEELGLAEALEAHLAALWTKLIKPGGSTASSEGADADEEEEDAAGGWRSVLRLNLVFVPSRAYAATKHDKVLSTLKATLDEKLSKQGPFLPAKALEASISALLPVSKEFVAGGAARSLPKEDTVISTFYLDKLVGRYAAQFRMDSRQLMEELNTGYDEDFGKTFSELIDKYLADFHQEVYGLDAGPIHTSLQHLNPSAVAAVVRAKKETLRKALLSLAEEGYTRQLQFLKQMAQEEFRKGISSLKYQWELIPGFSKAIKAARALFIDRAAKLTCNRGGPRWKNTADKELRSLTKILETQADDVIERTRAGGGFVPTKLRRPIGVQINWLGANFFHFLRDSSVDPLSIRTDSGVALWQTLGETWASRDGKDQRISQRYRAMYGADIDPQVQDYLLTNPKGVNVNDRDPRIKFGWQKRVAYELVRNHDDMTFQIPNAGAVKEY